MLVGSRTETDKTLPRIVALTPVLKQVLPQSAKTSLPSWLIHGEMLIGREVDADRGVCLSDDSKVSKRHAVLHLQGDLVEIQDLESKNHTYVDGREITRQQLRDGSVVRVGNSLFVLRFEKAGNVDASKIHHALHAQMLGQSSAVCELRRELSLAARTVDPVLLIGPTGTGKELAAEAVHAMSARSARPLVPVNCAAIPAGTAESALFGHRRGAFTGAERDHDGYFQQADGGTLFLDEVGELPLDMQAKLLRVLQPPSPAAESTGRYPLRFRPTGNRGDIEVDVRLIAATNVELEQAVQAGRFRSDLYQRLSVLLIRFPPLAARAEDILWLLHHYLNSDRRAQTRRVSARLGELLLSYSWPGNIRELFNLSKRLLAQGAAQDIIDLDAFPDELLRKMNTQQRCAAALEQDGAVTVSQQPVTADLLLRLLKENDGVISRVARLLERSPRQIRRRMEQFGIHSTGDAASKGATNQRRSGDDNIDPDDGEP